MEYLMTYGWAIIIILVVLGILYLLNVFTPNSLIGTTCTPQFKYLCQIPTLAVTGQLSFLFGQNTGATEYNLAFACTAASNVSTGQPYVAGRGNPWEYLNATGVLKTSYSATNAYTLFTNRQVYITGLTCYDQNGVALKENVLVNLPVTEFASAAVSSGSFSTTTTSISTSTIAPPGLAVGTPFVGTIWVKYTNSPGLANTTTNPYIVMQAASISTRVASSQTSSVSTTTTTIAIV